MTKADFKTLFLALGFTVAVLREETEDRQYPRAHTIADLIEAFCFTHMPESFSSDAVKTADEAEQLLNAYITELRDTESALMDFDRAALLRMYELLQLRKLRHDQQACYESGNDDLIANRVLQMAEDEIRREERL